MERMYTSYKSLAIALILSVTMISDYYDASW